MLLKIWRGQHLTILKPFLAVMGVCLLLPAAVVFRWPVLLWWMARLLSRSTRPWLAIGLAIVIGIQLDILTQQPLGVNILLFGGTVSWLELWRPSAVGWRQPLGDIVGGGLFCGLFLIVSQSWAGSYWWPQIAVLSGANLAAGGLTLWWQKK